MIRLAMLALLSVFLALPLLSFGGDRLPQDNAPQTVTAPLTPKTTPIIEAPATNIAPHYSLAIPPAASLPAHTLMSVPRRVESMSIDALLVYGADGQPELLMLMDKNKQVFSTFNVAK